MISFLEFYRILESIDPYSSDAYLKVAQSKYGWIDPRHGFYPATYLSHFEVLKNVPKYRDLVANHEQAAQSLQNAEDTWGDDNEDASSPMHGFAWNNQENIEKEEILKTEIYINVYSDGWVRIAIQGKTVHAEGLSSALTKLNGDIEDLANAINGQVEKRAIDQDLTKMKQQVDSYHASTNREKKFSQIRNTQNTPRYKDAKEVINKIVFDSRDHKPVYIAGQGTSNFYPVINTLGPDGRTGNVVNDPYTDGLKYFFPLNNFMSMVDKNELEKLKQLVVAKYKKQPILT